MKKIDQKGFTLIELLAVIVILAILMITAIPAVTNSIAKSRKDTFATNAKNVINAVRTSMASGDVKNGSEECSYPADGSAVKITITSDALKGLLERGGDKSSFGRAYNDSYVIIYNKGGDKFDYYIAITDKGSNGVDTLTKEMPKTLLEQLYQKDLKMLLLLLTYQLVQLAKLKGITDTFFSC